MKNYQIVNEEDGSVSILEKETRLKVFRNLTHSTAKKKCAKLNGGMGFRGWTPNFVMRKRK